MTAADLHPDTGGPRPGTCCGACPPIAGGGWDCTCPGLSGCPANEPGLAAGRAETTTDCGGCRGLGKHSPRCHTQPGYLWRRRADRAESLADEIGSNDTGMANRLYAVAGECRARAAGRAETTTATTEDAEQAVVDALGQSPFAHHEVIPSGETASTLYVTHDDEWADLASLIVQMLASRGLLATARTRPAEGEATDLDRLYSTLNLQGVWVLIDEVAGAVCPWCGDPWESEPSCEHAEAIYQHDNRVMAFALEQAADEIDWEWETFTAADGHLSIRQHGAAPSTLLRERAARLRGGETP